MSSTKPFQSHNRGHSHLGSIVVAAVSILAALLIFANRQQVIDQVTVWQYQPSSQIAGLASRSSMNSTGKFYFYASRPVVEDAQPFNQDCGRKEASTAILGCYNGQNIFIYNVTNTQLDGIKEVTAAHEMLHAAYARMGSAEKKTMDAIYGAPLHDADNRYLGAINLRKALALSRNIPAVKAMYIAGIDPTLQTIRALGDKNYCTQGADAQAGLSSAIGGCGTRMIDHVNAFASLGRLGVYKPYSTILEVTNSQGEVLKKYADTEHKQIVDPQVAYILSDMLSDDNARAGLYGYHFPGLWIDGVKMAVKTGTSDKGGQPKDIWNMGYTPALTMGVWLGNPDTSVLTNGNSSIPAKVLGPVMEYAHKEVYAKEKKWDPANGGTWFKEPTGIQHIGGELYPSWYNKSQGKTNDKLTFDKSSKKLATDCTPEGAKIEVNVQKFKDPITKRTNYIAPDGYDATKKDDVHKCSDAKPNVGTIDVTKNSGNSYKISVSVVAGNHPLQQLEVKVGSTIVATLSVSSSGTYSTNYTFTSSSAQTITATLTDSVYYTDTGTQSFTPDSSSDGGGGGGGG